MKVTTIVLACDGPDCHAQRQGRIGESAAQLRATMTKYGTWASNGERDLCSTCLARGVAL
jgi:hypothetical protein